MLAANIEKVDELLPEAALLLDVGGWARPLPRADWVIDLMPYESRGLYGDPIPGEERFDASTWVVRDICDREPWPFEDDEFDFVVCSHTLEDIRDPIWVCSELVRVAKAGYIEIPSRVDEQTRGVHGDWVGWSHHHWLIDVEGETVSFVLKPHLIHSDHRYEIPAELLGYLRPEERVQSLFWQGSFDFEERIFFEADELESYLVKTVSDWLPTLQERAGGSGGRLRRALRSARSA